MTMDKIRKRPGLSLLVGGGMLVLLAAALFIGSGALKRHYDSENRNVLEAVGRELSGTNVDARRRIGHLRTASAWLAGIGAALMAAGGALRHGGARESGPGA